MFYTTQKIEIIIELVPDWELWEIIDPDGVQICTVIGEDSAKALIIHLNKE